MKITTYSELTPAQEHTLDALEKVTVRPFVTRKTVMATIRTFQAQEIKIEIDPNGVIVNVGVNDAGA
ncbi:MAG: hypothetical protein PHU23_04930 [Dehalococcoidales bacterium]|nr:hypothetical protein [Dehalococcoidales bacterium]